MNVFCGGLFFDKIVFIGGNKLKNTKEEKIEGNRLV